MHCAHSQMQQTILYLQKARTKCAKRKMYIFFITEMILNLEQLLLLRMHDFQLNVVYLVVFIIAFPFDMRSILTLFTCGSGLLFDFS